MATLSAADPHTDTLPNRQVMGTTTLSTKDYALGGLLGAAALTLPFLFHLLHLGTIFMPMYLPLMLGPFLVHWRVAASLACTLPLLSALLTGMPPFFPPIAIAMAIELGLMATCAGLLYRRWPRRVLPVLLPVLLFGRLAQVGLGYAMGLVLELPAAFLSFASVMRGLPGVLLMLVVIPAIIRVVRSNTTTPMSDTGTHEVRPSP